MLLNHVTYILTYYNSLRYVNVSIIILYFDRIVCELGLGMNPNVTDLCGYTLLDEKMAGTFHIAVGANNMFGGENEATDHVDFVGRGEVEVIS